MIGEVTGTGRLEMTWHGELVVDIPPGSAADEGPVYDRPPQRPPGQDALQADDPARLGRPGTGARAARGAAGPARRRPDAADKSWVTEQYDRYVRGNTVLAMPQDAGLIRIDEQTGLGVALAIDGNGRYCQLDPYAGTQLALAEAYRNVAATGARPLAVTNCLNFGSPEDPAVMWQFSEAVRGLADGCLALGDPGDRRQRQLLQPDRRASRSSRRRSSACSACSTTCAAGCRSASAGRARRVVLLGRSEAELGGSLWAHVTHGHLGGRPPAVDLDAERALADGARRRRRGLLDAAHDLSDGGLALALAECCLAGGHGASRWSCRRTRSPALFSESAARAVVAVRPGAEAEFAALCQQHGVPATVLGQTGGASLEVTGSFSIGLDELAAAHRGTAARAVRLKVLAPRPSGRGHERDELLPARGRRAGCQLRGGPAWPGGQAPAVGQVAQLPVVEPARPGGPVLPDPALAGQQVLHRCSSTARAGAGVPEVGLRPAWAPGTARSAGR